MVPEQLDRPRFLLTVEAPHMERGDGHHGERRHPQRALAIGLLPGEDHERRDDDDQADGEPRQARRRGRARPRGGGREVHGGGDRRAAVDNDGDRAPESPVPALDPSRGACHGMDRHRGQQPQR